MDSADIVDVTSPPALFVVLVAAVASAAPTFFVVVAAVGSAPEIQNQN